MVRYYNPHESAIRSIFRWRYTLTSSVFSMFEFWLYMVIAFTVMVLMDRGVMDLPLGVVNLDVWKLLSPQLSVTIFAVVFYNNQCYGRYMSLYASCVDIDVSEKNLVSELLVDFGHDPDLQTNIKQACKYSLAAIFYFYLSMEDESPGMRVTWQVIKEKGLLSDAEVLRVCDYPGTTFMLLLHWASMAVKDGIWRLRVKPAPNYSPPELAAMTSRIFSLIDRIGLAALNVRSIQNMPVPFSYFHLLNILISLTVLATGIGSLILVEQHDSPSYCLAFFPYSVVTFVLLALRQLSGELADPFGQDDLDFPIADFMRHIYDNVVAMLAMFHRYNVLDSFRSGSSDFTCASVGRPCAGEAKEDQTLTKILQKSASRLPAPKSPGGGRASMGWLLLQTDDEISAYGPRNWVKPEDFKGAAKLIRWLESGDEPKARMIGVSMEDEENAPLKDAPLKDDAPNKAKEEPPAKPKELPKDSCAESLQRIEKQMAQLISCMSEVAASLKESSGSERRTKERTREGREATEKATERSEKSVQKRTKKTEEKERPEE